MCRSNSSGLRSAAAGLSNARRGVRMASREGKLFDYVNDDVSSTWHAAVAADTALIRLRVKRFRYTHSTDRFNKQNSHLYFEQCKIYLH